MRWAMRVEPCRQLMRKVLLSVVGAAAFAPALVSAEGAVRTLDCTAVRVCDAAGECQADQLEARFRMEPVATNADGSGQYAISYGDTRAEMQALSDAGPFFWAAGAERHTLLASSDREFVWHRVTVEPAPAATIRFLMCTFRQ